MGYLEEIHAFGKSEVDEVIRDIQQEFVLPTMEAKVKILSNAAPNEQTVNAPAILENMDERITRMERSVISVLDLLKQVISSSSGKTYTKQK